jgi:hypothetical protein
MLDGWNLIAIVRVLTGGYIKGEFGLILSFYSSGFHHVKMKDSSHHLRIRTTRTAVPWYWTSWPPELWANTYFFVINYTVCGILLQQHKWTTMGINIMGNQYRFCLLWAMWSRENELTELCSGKIIILTCQGCFESLHVSCHKKFSYWISIPINL